MLLNLREHRLTEDGVKLLSEFKEAIVDFQRKNNRQPILDMVGVLPKDELAAMAESLVNLTVFKRKVSKAVETVRGAYRCSCYIKRRWIYLGKEKALL